MSAANDVTDEEFAALDVAIDVAFLFRSGDYDILWSLRNRLKPFVPGDGHFDEEIEQ